VPVIEVTALPQADGIDVSAVAASVTRVVAAVVDEEPRGTWVVWRTLGAGEYSEGGEAPAAQPSSTHPPLVEVVGYEGRPPELVEQVLVAVADTLADELRLDRGNVFVRWVDATAGRLYTGGYVVGGAEQAQSGTPAPGE
jgi:phenylpyruvate tautomerase PptA (4-oxalocrotonate tautomerase family)